MAFVLSNVHLYQRTWALTTTATTTTKTNISLPVWVDKQLFIAQVLKVNRYLLMVVRCCCCCCCQRRKIFEISLPTKKYLNQEEGISATFVTNIVTKLSRNIGFHSQQNFFRNNRKWLDDDDDANEAHWLALRSRWWWWSSSSPMTF